VKYKENKRFFFFYFRDAAIATPHFSPLGKRIFSKEKVTNKRQNDRPLCHFVGV
jgi:hypothetical protein